MPETNQNLKSIFEEVLDAFELPSTKQLFYEQCQLVKCEKLESEDNSWLVHLKVHNNWINMMRGRASLLLKAFQSALGSDDVTVILQGIKKKWEENPICEFEIKPELQPETSFDFTPEIKSAKENAEKNKWEKIGERWSKVEKGFVYVFSNELMPGIYKIGFTSRTPEERATEMSYQIGLPSPFVVEKYWRTNDPYIVEQRIHEGLEQYRKPGEYFQVDLNLIYAEVEKHLIGSS